MTRKPLAAKEEMASFPGDRPALAIPYGGGIAVHCLRLPELTGADV